MGQADFNLLAGREAYQALPEFIMVREARIRVPQSGFRTRSIVVVTTLLDPQQATKEELAVLYRERWNAEFDMHALKEPAHGRSARPDAGDGA